MSHSGRSDGYIGGFAGRMGVEMAQTHRSPTEGRRGVSGGSVSQRKTFMRRPAALPVDGYGATGIVVQDTRMPTQTFAA